VNAVSRLKLAFLLGLALILGDGRAWGSSGNTLIWIVNGSVGAGGQSISFGGTVAIPDAGGSASFSSGVGSISVTATPTSFSISGSGSEFFTGLADCSASGGGSGSIATGSTSFTVHGNVSVSGSCTDFFGDPTFPFSGGGSFTASAAIPAAAGVLESVSGTVTITHNGQSFAASSGTTVSPGDTITTGNDGSVTVLLPGSDGTLSLSANGEFTFAQQGTSTQPALIDQILGTLHSIETCALLPGSQPCYRVRTPAACACVRGTDFTSTVTNSAGQSTTEVTVNSGIIDLIDNAGNTQTLNAGQSGSVSTAQANLVASILPLSRSVQIGNTATAFATIINAGPGNAVSCTIAPSPSQNLPILFSFQTTDPSTNAVTGTANAPVTIDAGASQTFVFAITPTAAFSATNVALQFTCNGSDTVTSITGLNTLLFSASATPVPDIVALSATTSGDGILHITGTNGSGAFAVATVNVGATSQITATANTGSATLPLALTLCQTNPQTGACLAAPSTSVATTIAAGATPTFAIFATASGAVAFAPATNRIFVQFADPGGVERGATSVAVDTR
jgi:hypothetical protein